ncbi:MAG: hypothetical protein ABIH71_04005 [Candidatus Omnitrophota bacterium]|nr:hypothetical protein [Candidatus Omnitrophota bacterium]
MAIAKSQKIIIYIVVVVAFIFLADRFFVSGLRDRLELLNRKVRLTERELKKGIAIEKTKDKILQDYEQSKPYLDVEVESDKHIVAMLLKEIESVIRICGGTVINLNPQEKETQLNIFKADFRLEMSFIQLLKFLNAIGESKLLIRLDKIAITSKDEAAQALRVDGVVSITIP